MRAHRLIFARPPRAASLLPIYAALLAVAAIALVGFVVAFWPHSESPRSSSAREEAPAHASPAIDGQRRALRDPRKQMRSM
jgi:hypothetical protein